MPRYVDMLMSSTLQLALVPELPSPLAQTKVLKPLGIADLVVLPYKIFRDMPQMRLLDAKTQFCLAHCSRGL